MRGYDFLFSFSKGFFLGEEGRMGVIPPVSKGCFF
jgi:hypothetical protein